MHSIYKSLILLLIIEIVLFFLYVYEKIMMFPDGPLQFDPLFLNLAVTGILFISILYFSLTKIKFNVIPIIFIIGFFLGYIWIVSIVLGGFQTNLGYIEGIIPFIIFIFALKSATQFKNDYLLYSILLIFILLTIYFLTNYQLNLINDVISQNNGSYTILLFLPFILSVPNRKIKVIFCIVTFFVMILSLKRGGLIAYILSLSIYYFIYKKLSLKKIIKFSIIVIILNIIIFCLLKIGDNQYIGPLIERFEGIEEDGGSGRTHIYSQVWNAIYEESLFFTILGHGWCKVQEIPNIKLSAHNDFLEIIYDFGLISLIIYLILLLYIIKFIRFLINKDDCLKAAAFASSIVITIIINTVSHIIIYPKFLLLTSLFWGYLIGRFQLDNKYKTINEEA